MSTPSDEPTYAPPYGSAPAFSNGGSGGAYGRVPDSGSRAWSEPTGSTRLDAPAAEPYGAQPYGTGAPTDDPYRPSAGDASPGTDAYPVADGTAQPPAAPPAARTRRGARGPVALLLACLLSGGVGGAVAHALDDGGSTTAASTVPTAIVRGGSTPPTAAAGTTQAAAATISPSVVTIAFSGSAAVQGGFGQSQQQQVSGTGSGIVLRKDGYIVTNNHVVADAVNGGSVSVTLYDGTTLPAKIVGTDPTSDLAVIKVDRNDLTPAAFADSDKLQVGQTVLAVGAPLGLSNTVTEGIVSTLDRPVRTGEAGASAQAVIDAVQTDAAINPGNSGGALVDLAGQVVGVNSAIATAGSSTTGGQAGNIGVGFAIPSNNVQKVAQELISSGKAVHPVIGINAGDAPGAATGTPGGGAQVQNVTSGGPAAGAGLQQGDVITKVDDRTVTDADSLIVAIRAHDPGDKVTVTYTRGGSTQTATATLAEAPTS